MDLMWIAIEICAVGILSDRVFVLCLFGEDAAERDSRRASSQDDIELRASKHVPYCFGAQNGALDLFRRSHRLARLGPRWPRAEGRRGDRE
jgi:hypothetical protein